MAEALRFECQPGCVACCTQKGFVYVSDADILRIAAYLRLSPEDFERRYVYRTARRARLRIPAAATCHFLFEGGCRIHEVKPTQCRTFPFWPELVETRREWRKTARYCPGIDKGPLVQIEIARDEARQMRQAYPALY